jgi:hypothetical protein
MRQNLKFFKFFALFLTAVFLLFRAADAYYPGGDPETKGLPSVRKSLAPNPLLKLKVLTAPEAKRQGYFWASDGTYDGVAIDVRSSPELFAELFPGYPDSMRSDSELWFRYFHFPFSVDSYFPSVQALTKPSFRMVYSWEGCVEVAERYGADVILIGNSEMFRAINPSRFAKNLPGDRVLVCGVDGMTNDTAKETAVILRAKLGRKVKAVVWAYSYWNTFSSGDVILHNVERLRHELEVASSFLFLEQFSAGRLFHRWGDISPAHAFPTFSWESWENSRLAGLFKAKKREGNQVKGAYVSRAVALDPVALEETLKKKNKPYYGIFDGFRSCEESLGGADESFSATISALRDLGENVFVYLTPTTPFITKAAPDCVMNKAISMLESSGVHSLTLDWKAYGLDYSDFLRPTIHPDTLRLDANHTNEVGSKKVTDRIGAWVAKQLKERK